MSNRFEAMSDRDLFGSVEIWSCNGDTDAQLAALQAERDGEHG